MKRVEARFLQSAANETFLYVYADQKTKKYRYYEYVKKPRKHPSVKPVVVKRGYVEKRQGQRMINQGNNRIQ